MLSRSPIPKPFRTTIWWHQASPSHFCSLPIRNRSQTSVSNIILVTGKRRTGRLRKFSTPKTGRARWSFRLVRTPTTYIETPRPTSYVRYHWKGVALQLFPRWNPTKKRHVFGTKGNTSLTAQVRRNKWFFIPTAVSFRLTDDLRKNMLRTDLRDRTCSP